MMEKFLTLLALISHLQHFGQNWPKNMAILAIMAKMKLLSRVQTTASKIGALAQKETVEKKIEIG